MTILWLGIAFALLIMALTSLMNAITFPRLRVASAPTTDLVSILIPARNESNTIAKTITALRAQDYENFEVIVLDDGSEDGTAQIAEAAAQNDARIKIITGKKLPSGWLGKNWACHQLSEVATGGILIFTDADVRWEPNALSAVLALMNKTRADMFTVWPTQTTITWPERLVVPLMSLAIIAYLPEIMVRHSPFAMFAAANGQCLAFRRAIYDAIGGHIAVQSNIIEDIGLARLTKQHGKKLVMSDGNNIIGCRMYDDWASVRDGFAKNILAGHLNSVPILCLSTILHWLVFLAPWIGLLIAPIPALFLIGGGMVIRMLTAIVTRQRWYDAVLMPISVVLMTRIAWRAVWWRWHLGGPQWKGRIIQS